MFTTTTKVCILKVGRIGFFYTATKVCILKVGRIGFVYTTAMYTQGTKIGVVYTTIKVCILKVRGDRAFFTPLPRYVYS